MLLLKCCKNAKYCLTSNFSIKVLLITNYHNNLNVSLHIKLEDFIEQQGNLLSVITFSTSSINNKMTWEFQLRVLTSKEQESKYLRASNESVVSLARYLTMHWPAWSRKSPMHATSRVRYVLSNIPGSCSVPYVLNELVKFLSLSLIFQV